VSTKLPIKSDKSQAVQFSSEMPLKDQSHHPLPKYLYYVINYAKKPVKVKMPGMMRNPHNRCEGEVAEETRRCYNSSVNVIRLDVGDYRNVLYLGKK
jgi:hypothetical protein